MENLILIYCIIIFLIVISLVYIITKKEVGGRSVFEKNRTIILYAGITCIGLMVLHVNITLLPWLMDMQGLMPLLKVTGLLIIYVMFHILHFQHFLKSNQFLEGKGFKKWEKELNSKIAEILNSKILP
jgi:hypothetical protein